MVDTAQPAAPEKTFRAYSTAQGQTYAKYRPGYPVQIYNDIVAFHTDNGGALGTLLDVGCGPGTSVREFAGQFTRAVAIDPSEGMLSAARTEQASAEKAGTAPAITFAVSSAEALGSDHTPPLVADGSVDVITAATSAHWFDMAGFWARAAEVLKPGGTVAIWSIGGGPPRLDPAGPAAAEVQAIMDSIDGQLAEFHVHGNGLVRGYYADLPMPWASSAKTAAQFDAPSFVRRLWCSGPGYGPEFVRYTTDRRSIPLSALERLYGTGSPITRWREAHPELVGTDQDIIRAAFLKIERLLRAAGVEPGKETLSGAYSGVLLLVRRV